MSEQNAIDPCVLFIGNIPYSYLDNELISLVSSFGEVVAASVVRDERERSRGFGFVRFADSASAEAALNALHESEIDGRTIRVNRARNDSRYIDLVAQ